MYVGVGLETIDVWAVSGAMVSVHGRAKEVVCGKVKKVVTKILCVIGWNYYEQLPPTTTESSAAPI